MNHKKLLMAIFAIGTTYWMYAFAANRKVTIPADTDGIKLFNGWTSSVSFTATCYSTTGSLAFSTDITLPSRQSTNLVASGTATCLNGGGTLDTTGMNNGMGGCPTLYTDNATALTSCPTNYQPCSPQQWFANRVSATTDGFLADMAPTWSFSTDAGGTWTNNSSGKPRGSYTSTEICATAAAGGGSQIPYCTSTEYATWDGGVICCPTVGTASSCVVEITSAGGHLQSPQFKGNAPF